MSGVESRLMTVIAYSVLGVCAFIALFPLALLALNALKSANEIVTNPLALPTSIKWENFSNAWRDANLGQTFVNSAILSATTIVLVLITGSLTAYVLARKKIKTWQVWTTYLLAASTAPIQLFLIPLYFGYARLGLINNVFAVAVIQTAVFSPFAILLLRTYFLAVPRELEEQAIIDGASGWQVFTRVMLPIVRPGLLTVALIVGLNSWNEFLISSTFLQQSDKTTVIVSFFLLSGQYTSDWGEIMAGAFLIVVPVIALFIFLQRKFIEGMTGGSVKG